MTQIWLLSDNQILLKNTTHLKRKLLASDLTIETRRFKIAKKVAYQEWFLKIKKKEAIEHFSVIRRRDVAVQRPYRDENQINIEVYIFQKHLDKIQKQIIAQRFHGEFVNIKQFERRITFGGDGTYKYGVENMDPLIAVLLTISEL
jgi:hypothetical protein